MIFFVVELWKFVKAIILPKFVGVHYAYTPIACTTSLIAAIFDAWYNAATNTTQQTLNNKRMETTLVKWSNDSKNIFRYFSLIFEVQLL